MLLTDSKKRKNTPICTGALDYFPLAIAAVARLSKWGNDKHNPGQEMHWAREKSTDQADCIARHLIDRGTIDPESGELHDVGLAWRALANLQLAEEKRLGPESTTVVESKGQTTFMWGEPTGGQYDPWSDKWVPDEPAPVVAPKPAKKPFTFWYLATPYSKYPHGHNAAFGLAARRAAELMAYDIPVFAPIAHSHPAADYLPKSDRTNHDFWMKVDAPFMEVASGLIVVAADGWQDSAGMKEEIKRFGAAGKPVVFWEPIQPPPLTVLKSHMGLT